MTQSGPKLDRADALYSGVLTGAGNFDIAYYKTLIDQIPDCIFVKDRHHRFVIANAATAELNGFSVHEEIIGLSDADVCAPELARELAAVEAEIMLTGNGRFDIEEYMLIDGRPSWRLTSKLPLRDEHGQIVGLVGISRDITKRKREETLRAGQARLLEMIACSEPLAEILATLVLIVEAQVNEIAGSVLLMDPDGVHLRHGAAPNLPAEYTRAIDGSAIGPNVGSCGTAAWLGQPVVVSDILTDERWEQFRDLAILHRFRSCWSTPITTAEGRVLGTLALYSHEVRSPTEDEMQLVAMATHIAGIAIERRRAEERIHFIAHHDSLTGLLNRNQFAEKVSMQLRDAADSGMRVTMAYIDLDNFKQINDQLGHAVGDELLRQMAERMRHFARATDLIVRLGGDEFVLVMTHTSATRTGIVPRLKELREALSKPIILDGVEIRATCSMGIASFPEDGVTADDLLARADAAMYRAKNAGRNTLDVS